MSAIYFAIPTNAGQARIANALTLGIPLKITHMAIGDGNGQPVTPNPAQTALAREVRRAPLNTLFQDPLNPAQLVAEQIIPEDTGGWWVREVGLYDDSGTLIAVANTPETYKPLLTSGAGRTQTIRMVLIVSDTSAVELKIDPSVVLATRKYVDNAGAAINKLLRDELTGKCGASVIGSESGKSVQYELESIKMDLNKSLLAQIKFKAQRANSQWGQPGPINILADSMGFGYFASYENGVPTYGGMFYHRWVSILARMFAAEFNTGHYLTCNPNIYEYGGDEDIVKRVAYNGTWTLKNAGLYTSNLLVGQAACTSTPGAYSDYKFPATFSNCWIYYVVQPGGGELTITKNGSEPMVISCDGPELKNAVISIPVTANPQGYCTLRIAKSDVGSGEVGVSAISPTQGVRENGYKEGAGLNAFAAPGRRLQDVSESVIAAACQNAAGLILALGFNDNPLNGSGQEVGRAAFTQRVNWVISNCKANNTPLIVADFSWKNTKDQFTRMELRRAASEVGGIYIPFPDMLQGGTVPNEAERLASGMWHDAAHPNKKGHKWIAESIGKAIGLSCSSKNEAIRNHDYWMSLPLTSTFSNILTNIPRNLAAYKISGDFVHIRTQIKMAAGGAFPVGVNTICGDAVNSMWWIVPPLKLNAFYLTKLHDVNENTGVIQGFSSFTGAGVKSGVLGLIRPSGISLTAFNGASSFEIERWDSADV